MGEKTKIKQLAGVLGPGPGGYTVDKAKVQNFSYSMGAKVMDIEFSKQTYKPGPGNYEPNARSSIPSMKFGTGSRTSLDGGKEVKYKPGPGAYSGDAHNVQKSSPKFGFGSSTREGFKTLNVPGPGNYASKTYTGKDGPNYSMGALSTYAPKVKEEGMKPGPGVYSPVTSPTKKKEPAFKIGSEVRNNLAADK